MLAVIATASCTGDTDEIVGGVGEKVPVTFNLTSAPITITRATYDDGATWATGQEIAVKCTADGESINTNDVKKYVTADNGSGGIKLVGYDTSNTFYWLNKTVSKSFQLWYPYSATMPTSMTVAADQSSATDAAFASYDLLYAVSTGLTAATSNVATLAFYHQMSRLTVNVAFDASVTGETVSGITMGNSDIKRTCTTWTPKAANDDASTGGLEGAEWGSLSDASTITLRSISATQYTCILPPQTVASTKLLTITTTGNGTRTYILNDGITLCAGNHHTINVTLSRTGITVNTTVNTWNATDYSGTVTF